MSPKREASEASFFPNELGVRVLLESRCNLACVFCHNEFQGAADSVGRTFDLEQLRGLLSSVPANRITLKLSGGEPLLAQSELLGVLSLANTVPTVTGTVMLSNLQVPVTLGLARRLAVNGLQCVRANVPSLDPERYRQLVGRSVGLQRVEAAVTALTSQGIRVEFNVVVDDPSPHQLRETITEYAKQAALAWPQVSLLRFIANAYVARSLSDSELVLKQLGFARIDRRAWRRPGETQLIVTHCDDWNAAHPEADWYVVPPGRRLVALSPTHAAPISSHSNTVSTSAV
jgi:molybdenum cofactor biosynthesis enzyme MoaA